MRDFRKYEVWQLSHMLVLEIYKVTQKFPQSEMYGITNQMRRAAVSVPTNISEGCGRNTDAEFARFIHIAAGSANETEYLVQLSFDLKFLDEDYYRDLTEKINLVKKKLFHLNKSLQTKS
ncbi:MAG: four helix bundle protein [Bacteroidetes bacterium]|nr:four helix bundle protein [Bacteroidota bacterium]